ncbi:uncharacterized protein LOC135397505 [Ornithodoros turicata]|uniref:uncharacterized protein LOC135397505 n=1 Tax=Ornithodoros turicata TaxID=34597 RepID=UPI003139586D
MVVPILKPGKSPHNIDSFRPIALTSCVGKVMERMVSSRLNWYLESTMFFPEAMAGFRQGRSSIDNVIDIVSSTQQARSEGKLTVAVFLDVMKAYDSVLHSTIVATLQEAGVGNRPLSWIQDFLCNRSLFIRTADGDTATFAVQSGVPQGCVLSPLFFNVIMASLPSQISNDVNVTIYADDICLWTSSTRRDTIQLRLQGALNTVESYLSDRGLSVSPCKTSAMAFSRRSFQNYPLRVAGAQLSFVRQCTYLGITIDAGLSWSPHVRALSSKANSLANVLRRISGASWGPSYADLRHVHNSLTLGALRYSLPVLHGPARSCTTSETFSVLAEAGEPPAPILRDKETLRTYARFITLHPLHHLRTIPQKYPDSAFGDAIRRLNGRLPPAPAGSFAPPMWPFDRPTTITRIPGLSRKHDTPTGVARQLALEHIYSLHDQRVPIYTDGSVIPGGSAAAFYVPHAHCRHGFKLPYETSSTETEMIAIYEALKFISASVPAPWTIFTDSKAALEVLSSFSIPLVQDIGALIVQCLSRLARAGHSVWLQWVPGHTGLPGNTSADAAAKQAHTSTPLLSVPLSPSSCRLHIRRMCAQHTRLFTESAVPARTFLHSIDPKMELTIPLSLTRRESSLLHRLRLNVAKTPSRQFLMGNIGSPLCTKCGVVADTTHLLLHCRLYSSARAALEQQLTHLGLHLTLRTLLGPVQRARQCVVTRLLLRYLAATDLLVAL